MRTSVGKKVALLQAITVERGATPAEAESAAAKVAELSQQDEREEAVRLLMDKHGWGEVLARGIVAGLDRVPPWEAETDWRWGQLYDWASCNGHQDPTTLKTQMAYLSDDLRNAFQAVGAAISAAKTEEEATKVFKQYADRLLNPA